MSLECSLPQWTFKEQFGFMRNLRVDRFSAAGMLLVPERACMELCLLSAGVFRDGLFPFNWAMPLSPGGANEQMFP